MTMWKSDSKPAVASLAAAAAAVIASSDTLVNGVELALDDAVLLSVCVTEDPDAAAAACACDTWFRSDGVCNASAPDVDDPRS
jgi:hypothetical protein